MSILTTIIEAWIARHAARLIAAGARMAVDQYLAEWEYRARPEAKNLLNAYGKQRVRILCAQLREELGIPKPEDPEPPAQAA